MVSKSDGRELGHGEERWSRDKLAGKAATTQFIAVSCFASTPPLKSSLILVPLSWEVQFTLQILQLLLPPPPPSSASAKLLAGTVTVPNPASLPCWHGLTPGSLQSFLSAETRSGIYSHNESPYPI